MPKPNSDCRATERKHPWPMVRLGDVLDTGAGGTPLKQHRDYYDGGNIPWLRSGEVCKKDITETELFITVSGMENSSAKLFPRDSVVVAMYGATAGQVGILRIESTTNQAVCAIFPSSKHVPEFLYYQLLGMKEEMVSQAQGGAQPNISQIKIKNLRICLPPLSVQREIVARLERELAAVEEMKKGFEELAETARAEFKAELKEVFEELKSSTETCRLGDLCKIRAGKKDVRQGNPHGKYPFFTCAKTCTFADTYSYDCAALLVAGNGDVGYTQKYVGKFEVYQRTYVLYDFKDVDIDFVYYLMTGEFQEWAYSKLMGNTMPYIKMGVLSEFQVPVPSLSVQHHTISRLASAKAHAKFLEAKAREGAAVCETMRKAILKEAFE